MRPPEVGLASMETAPSVHWEGPRRRDPAALARELYGVAQQVRHNDSDLGREHRGGLQLGVNVEVNLEVAVLDAGGEKPQNRLASRGVLTEVHGRLRPEFVLSLC